MRILSEWELTSPTPEAGGTVKATSTQFDRARRSGPVTQTVTFKGATHMLMSGPKAEEPTAVQGPTGEELDALEKSLGAHDKVLRIGALRYVVVRAAVKVSEP
jgi:hypothetical protein